MKQHNYLLVGLGGTGCAVVRELKKKLYVEWRSRGGTGSYPEAYTFQDEFGGERVESRIATLSVDSNQSDLDGQGERARKWRVFGETLNLRDREKVLINPTGIERILGSVERYPGIAPWIRNDLQFVRDITRGSTAPSGCNQIRRMGRLALANGNSIENVVKGVANRLGELSRAGQLGAEIHIACTLAAGTGSGSLIDVIAQIQRHLKSRPGNFDLFVHAFATAKDVGDVNTGNFYANQYAALMELNAFRLALYEPWDITAPSSPRRLSVPAPGTATGDLPATYKAVALITDATEGGADVPLNQQIENVAELIFQMAVRQMGDVPKVLRDALTMEDRAQYPADLNGGNRATAFIGYGVQRVAIPEREIREKLSYSFARQFVLKVLYHNWDNRFWESPRSFARDSFVDTRRELWRVTRDHLSLDLVEDVTGQRQLDAYETEWRTALKEEGRGAVEILGGDYEGRKQWITDFDRRAERYWMQGFRSRGEGGGVVDYFKIRREAAEIRSRARSLRGVIEKDLILNLERLNPEYPLHHLPNAVDFLIQRVEADRLYFGDLAQQSDDNLKQADRTRAEILQQYQKAGRWAKGKHERLFSDYTETTLRHYYWRTMQLAAGYAQDFCGVLIDELKLLQQQVGLFDTRLKLIATSFEAELNARISESDPARTRDDLLYLVDARYVNETIRTRFESDKSVQDVRADVAMKTLAQLRGDRFELAAYTERMPVDDADRVGGPFVDELRRISEINAIEAHRKIREDDAKFEGIFGQNIVRKLYSDYGGRVDGDLESWLRQLIDRAMPMVAFDPNEERMDVAADGPVLRRCVFLPRCKSVPETFARELRERIQSITGARGGCKVVETYLQEVPEERNPTEIAIVSVAFFFPVRFTRVAHGLKRLYLERQSQTSEEESRRAYFEVHTETHNPRLPDLMKLDRGTVLQEQLAPVLLATALGLMQTPPEDGKPILFGTVDSFGRTQEKIETGMRMSAEIREAATESKERFGHEIPVETIALYRQYLESFQETCLGDVAKLAAKRIREDRALNLPAVAERLTAISGHCFLLSGRNEENKTYALFDTKAREAIELARRLADRSVL